MVGEQTGEPILQGFDGGFRQFLRAEGVIGRTPDLGAPRNGDHVMKGGDPASRAGEGGRLRRMGVDDGADVVACSENVAVEAPFARWPSASVPAPLQIHQRYVLGHQRFVGHAGGAHEERVLVAANADIARFAVAQPATRKLAAAADDGVARILLVHDRALRLGSRLASPDRVAAQTPRSVINPVTSRAGVTSNAILRAALDFGTTLTRSRLPEALSPVTCVSSSGDRSSIGMSPPSTMPQSMVLNGSAT